MAVHIKTCILHQIQILSPYYFLSVLLGLASDASHGQEVLSDPRQTAELKVIAKLLVKKDMQEMETDTCQQEKSKQKPWVKSDHHNKECPRPSAFSSQL